MLPSQKWLLSDSERGYFCSWAIFGGKIKGVQCTSFLLSFAIIYTLQQNEAGMGTLL